MADEREQIEKQLNQALEMQANLEKKLKKIGDGPRAESFRLQYEKVSELADHLRKKLDETV